MCNIFSCRIVTCALNLSVWLSLCPSVCLSVCLSACLPVCSSQIYLCLTVYLTLPTESKFVCLCLYVSLATVNDESLVKKYRILTEFEVFMYWKDLPLANSDAEQRSGVALRFERGGGSFQYMNTEKRG